MLGRSQLASKNPIKRFIISVLMQAQQECATELIIGSAQTNGDTPIRYKVEGYWYDLAPFSSRMRTVVVAEIGRMTGFSRNQFPKDGVLSLTFEGTQVLWRVRIASQDAECIFTRRDT